MPSFRRKPVSSACLTRGLYFNFAGGSPAAGYFSCSAKKSNQKKAAPAHRPCGLPCAARQAGGLPPRVTSFGARNSPSQKREGSDSPRRLPPAWLRCSAAHRGDTRCLVLVTEFLAPYGDNGRNPEVHSGYPKGRNNTIPLF